MRAYPVVVFVLLLSLGVAGCGGGGGGGGATSTAGGASQVSISVTGSAPNGATVSYSNDSVTFTGHVPLHTHLALDPRTGFYVVFVQLKNGGNVTCTVTIGSATSVGHARGGHKSCLAKLTNRYDGTWYPTH